MVLLDVYSGRDCRNAGDHSEESESRGARKLFVVVQGWVLWAHWGCYDDRIDWRLSNSDAKRVN